MSFVEQFFTEDIVRIVMIGIMIAFLIFYVIYGSFTAYHAIRFGFKGDLSGLSIIVFIAGTILLLILIAGFFFA